MVWIMEGCKDLSPIHNYALKASLALKAYPDQAYSFTSSYMKYKVPYKLFKSSMARGNGNMMSLPDMDDSLKWLPELSSNQKVDSCIKMFASGISNYFGAIAAITDKNLNPNYYDTLGNYIMNDAAVNTALNLNPKVVLSGISFAMVGTRIIQGKYAEKKLSGLMIHYDDSLKLSTGALQDIIQKAVFFQIETDKRRIYGFYQDLLANGKIAYGNKVQFIEDYYQKELDLNIAHQSYIPVLKELDNIRSTHHQLVHNLKLGLAITSPPNKDLLEKSLKSINSLMAIPINKN
jgi:hypothetical protein